MKRHLERTEQEELLFGTLASTIANYAGKVLKEGTHLAPSDFMPTLRSRKRAAERVIPKEDIARNISNFLWQQAKACGYKLTNPEPGASATGDG
jgi:hypothetical protein